MQMVRYLSLLADIIAATEELPMAEDVLAGVAKA